MFHKSVRGFAMRTCSHFLNGERILIVWVIPPKRKALHINLEQQGSYGNKFPCARIRSGKALAFETALQDSLRHAGLVIAEETAVRRI